MIFLGIKYQFKKIILESRRLIFDFKVLQKNYFEGFFDEAAF